MAMSEEYKARLQLAIEADEAGTKAALEAAYGSIDAKMRAEIEKQLKISEEGRAKEAASSKAFAQKEVETNQKKTEAIIGQEKKVAEAKKQAAQTSAGVAQAAGSDWKETLNDVTKASVAAYSTLGVLKMVKDQVLSTVNETIRVSNIYSSVTGSIDDARAAVQGTVSDLDLFIAKNQATNAGLDLTESQFATAAKAADDYADSVGTNTKDALDKVITALASSNARVFKQMGILIDVEAVNKRYAASLGKTAEALTDEEKKTAFLGEALDKVAAKASGSASAQVSFATAIEQMTSRATNAWNGMLAAIGNSSALGDAFRLLRAVGTLGSGDDNDLKSRLLNAKNPEEYKKLLDQLRAQLEAPREAARSAYGKEAGLAAYDADLESRMDPTREADLQRATQQHIFSAKKPKGTKYDLLADYETDVARRIKAAKDAAEQEYNDAIGLAFGAAGKQFDPFDPGAAVNPDDNKAEFELITKPALQAEAYAKAMGTAKEAQDRLTASIATSREKSGGGIVAAMLFGDGNKGKPLIGEGFESQENAGGALGKLLFGSKGDATKTFDDLTAAEQFAVESFSRISAAGEQMANALGQSLAASIGEDKNFKAALKEKTHAVLMAIASTSFAQAAVQTAEGLASLALGPIGGLSAGEHFAAAAAFTAAGALAGAGARATYTPDAGTGSIPATSRGGGVASTSSGSGGGNAQKSGDVNLYFQNILPGMEEKVGQSIVKYLKMEKAATGRDLIFELGAD